MVVWLPTTIHGAAMDSTSVRSSLSERSNSESTAGRAKRASVLAAFSARSAAAKTAEARAAMQTTVRVAGEGVQSWNHTINSYTPPAMRLRCNWAVETLYRERKNAGTLDWRLRGYRFLASPVSTPSSHLFAFFILLISFASVLTFGIESAEQAGLVRDAVALHGDNSTAIEEHIASHDHGNSGWYAWNVACAAVFSLELIARLVTYHEPHRDVMLWIDALALLPLLLRLICPTLDDIFRISALELYLPGKFHSHAGGTALYLNAAFSALRLLKMTRYMLGTEILRITLRESVTALVIPVYLLFMLCTFLGTAIFALEYDPLDVDNGSRLTDVTTAWWMLLVTMTTVGYGDYSPQTGAGRVVMGFAMIAGLAIFAMPLAIVGNNFCMAWEGRTMALIGEEIKRDLLRKGLSVNDVLEAFEGFDRNHDGVCSYKEFKRALKQMRINLPTKKLRQAWKMLDHDESGEVKYSEFTAALFPELEDDVLAEMLKQHSKKHSRQPINLSHDATSFLSLLPSEDSMGASVSVASGRPLERVAEGGDDGGNGGAPPTASAGATERAEASRPAVALPQRVENDLSEPSMVDDSEDLGVGERARLARLEEAMEKLAQQQRGLQRTMDTVLALLRDAPSPATDAGGSKSKLAKI